LVLERFIAGSRCASESLKTWNSYIMSAKKLDEVLRLQGIEGTELICGNNSANVDVFYI
jgi:hypothetical protein